MGYAYYWKVGGYWVPCADKDAWLAALLAARFNPKPPRWWIEEQLLEEKRDSKTAGIVWNTAYKPQRKFLIWSQASDEDFREHEYLR